MRPHGVMAIPYHDENHLQRLAEVGCPIMGYMRFDYDRNKKLSKWCKPDKTRLYYRPLHAGEGAPQWPDPFSRLSADEAVKTWVKLSEKDGNSLEKMLKVMTDRGFRPIVQILNEPWQVLDNMKEARRLGQFMLGCCEWLAQRDAIGAVAAFSTGTINRKLVQHMPEAIDACKAGIGIWEHHEYSPIWVTVWMGKNQSEGVSIDAPQEEKWAAIMRDPYVGGTLDKPGFAKTANWWPAYLNGRMWGLPDDDEEGIHGIPELYDVPLMKGEGEIDTILDDRLPFRTEHEPFGGVKTTIYQIQKRLGIHEHEVAVKGFELMDYLHNMLVRDDGSSHVKYTMAFALGPGDSYGPHDVAWCDKAFDKFVEYQERVRGRPAPEGLKVSELNNPPESEEPEPEKPPIVVPPEEEKPPTPEPPSIQINFTRYLESRLAALEAQVAAAQAEIALVKEMLNSLGGTVS